MASSSPKNPSQVAKAPSDGGDDGGDPTRICLRVTIPQNQLKIIKTLKLEKELTVAETLDIIRKQLPQQYHGIDFNVFWRDRKLDPDKILGDFAFKPMDTIFVLAVNQHELQAVAKMTKPRRFSESSHIHTGHTTSGYLMKKKVTRGLSSWKKRWCVLKDNCLYYFSSPKDREALGFMDLDHSRIQFNLSAKKAKQRTLWTVASNTGSYTLNCSNETEALSWYNAVVSRKSNVNKLIGNAIFSGYLAKKNVRSMGTAKSKWFVLSGNHLYWYNSPEDVETPQGQFNLFENKITYDSSAFLVGIDTVDDKFELNASKEANFINWKDAISSVIGDLGTEVAPKKKRNKSNSKAPMIDPETVIKTGWLKKRKENRRFSKNRKRFFVLSKDHKLYYYADAFSENSKQNKQPLGYFDLLHTHVNFYLFEDEGAAPPEFELVTTGGVYTITGDSAVETEEWITAIKAECVGVPFNVVHKAHVDFEYKWSGGKPQDMFQFHELLGKGAYAEVFRATHRESGFELALKVLKIPKDRRSMKIQFQVLQQEIDVLKKCRSPAIVSYYGTCSLENELWVLMDYCGIGSVKDMARKIKMLPTEAQIAYICKETLLGLTYLHASNIIHHDVKGGNILVNDEGRVKLADFGVSQSHKDLSNLEAEDLIGSPLFMSPEIIKRTNYNHKTDIWSLGITLIEIAQGRPPNTHINSFQGLLQIPDLPSATLQHPEKYSPEFNDFIAKCLTKDMDLRPDTINLLTHPFVLNAKGPECLLGYIKKYKDIREGELQKFRAEEAKKARAKMLQEVRNLASRNKGKK